VAEQADQLVALEGRLSLMEASFRSSASALRHGNQAAEVSQATPAAALQAEVLQEVHSTLREPLEAELDALEVEMVQISERNQQLELELQKAKLCTTPSLQCEGVDKQLLKSRKVAARRRTITLPLPACLGVYTPPTPAPKAHTLPSTCPPAEHPEASALPTSNAPQGADRAQLTGGLSQDEGKASAACNSEAERSPSKVGVKKALSSSPLWKRLVQVDHDDSPEMQESSFNTKLGRSYRLMEARMNDAGVDFENDKLSKRCSCEAAETKGSRQLDGLESSILADQKAQLIPTPLRVMNC
jgi:hypothetical protein